MKIDIWSDIACPFCYIGFKKLQSVLNDFEHKDQVELVWHSYELNPDLPNKALETSFLQYFAEAKGVTETEVTNDLTNLTELAKSVGLDFNLDKLVVANTSFALRLIKLANEKNLATEAEELLFKAYFTDGKDISDKQTLTVMGKKLSLDEDAIESIFKRNIYKIEVDNDTKYGDEELDLEYIPYYLFNKEHIIQGSVAPEDYKQILEKSFAEWKKRGESTSRGDAISGQSCSIDGVCS